MTMTGAFQELFSVLRTIDDSFVERLHPPVSTETLLALESTLGFRLPDDVRAWYALHGGQKDKIAMGTLFGRRLLTPEEIIWQYDMFTEIRAAEDVEDIEDSDDETDLRFTQPFAGAGHVPLTDMDTGTFLGVDTQPGVEGTHGQVILSGARLTGIQVAFRSLSEMAEVFTEQLRAGNYRVCSEPNFYPYPWLEFKSTDFSPTVAWL
jgi:cell wall assembly regulator SMI1